MKGALGFGGLTLGFMAAALGVVTLGVGIRRRDGRIMATGRQFVFMVLLGAVIAAGAMEWALVTHDFSIAYVVRGKVKSTVGSEVFIMGPGDVCRHPKGVLHGLEAIEESVVVEIKSPAPDIGAFFATRA